MKVTLYLVARDGGISHAFETEYERVCDAAILQYADKFYTFSGKVWGEAAYNFAEADLLVLTPNLGLK